MDFSLIIESLPIYLGGSGPRLGWWLLLLLLVYLLQSH